jgi:chemotaxis signal transduction protein
MNTLQTMSCIIVSHKEIRLVLPLAQVKRIVIVPEVLPMPRMPAFARGVISMGGRVIPLLDLGKLLNEPAYHDDMESLISLLHEREEDHKKWLAELEQSLIERRPFRLSRDPRHCAFGKWYDSFKTNDKKLQAVLKKFKAPHIRIHAIADEALAIAKGGDYEGALALIERTRDFELHTLIDMFDITRLIIRDRHRRLAVILEHKGDQLALSIDAVEAYETIDERAIQERGTNLANLSTDLITGIWRGEEGARDCLVLDVRRLFAEK